MAKNLSWMVNSVEVANKFVIFLHFKAPGTSKSAGLRVTQSASLYSMSSGSSNVSGWS